MDRVSTMTPPGAPTDPRGPPVGPGLPTQAEEETPRPPRGLGAFGMPAFKTAAPTQRIVGFPMAAESPGLPGTARPPW